jgi:hypothetical protein
LRPESNFNCAFDLIGDAWFNGAANFGASYSAQKDQAHIGVYGSTLTKQVGCIMWVNTP